MSPDAADNPILVDCPPNTHRKLAVYDNKIIGEVFFDSIDGHFFVNWNHFGNEVSDRGLFTDHDKKED
jgi:hypothetical protein